MNRRFERSGEIRDVDLLAAFVGLWRDRASVTLDFARPGVTAGLDIADGEVVSTFSADPRFETAAILVRAGKLDAAALERLAVPEGSDQAMAAMQAGVLTKREWKWGEKIRAIEVLSDLLTWNEGRYLSEPDARSVSGEFHLSIPRLLLELFLRSRDRALVDHQLGNPDAILMRSEDFDAEFATFGLTADAESVVRLIDGKATAREIASKAPADAFAVDKLLAALVTLGLLRPGDLGPAAALEPPAPERPAAEEREAHDTFDAQFWRPAEGAAAPEETLHDPPDVPEPAPPERDVALELGPEPAAAASWLNTPAPGALEPALQKVDEPVEQPPRRGQGPILIAVFALLAVAVAAVLFFRSRTGGGAASVQPERTVAALAPTQAPRPTEAPPPTAPALTAKPAVVKLTRRAPTARPTLAPTKAPAAATAPPESKPWLDRAEASRRRLAMEPDTRFAVQLLLACEVPTLEDAFRHEQPPGSMWLLATDHKGRMCFKVLWGRFGTVEEAKKAKDSVPSHFVSSSNRPAVVVVR
jgi:hypothetical protein